MAGISETIARLAAFRKMGGSAMQTSRLAELTAFGSNPGALRAYRYAPGGLPQGAPLVVVLHGCTQTAADYDHGSGWSQLADRHGFALLFPEQQRANNPNRCFNWFVPGDIRRDSGEALSIAQMVGTMIGSHALDRRRVFVTGLSAGGAMAAAMLATYPELFAGGAIIAGLPFGCASSVPEALDRMRGHGLSGDEALQRAVSNASGHAGPWPTLSIWHGMQDRTVVPANSGALISQWRGVHGLGPTPTRTVGVDGHTRRVWCDATGVAQIEAFEIAGMGHGTPLDAKDAIGAPRAFMLHAGISSTRHIAAFWQLGEPVAALAQDRRTTNAAATGSTRRQNDRPFPDESKAAKAAASGPAKVIEDALRAAGLMR
ncbi:PHB depolymerase family esterase [Bosea sp. 124]|uniref:extracellular catalytic domain type 1 short-chain-length polyhydroxyalkanoate depolymerase n=1 Tax=Bosea sp. 124 TaxID=2135642 RepID=UPI000D35DD81|nr:PHB depolymerase family esterase [Bosea sp. 124]PTM40873.1 poly(hydroxyalkanoate) depolymerase family esterase [Bosea sp. 124]